VNSEITTEMLDHTIQWCEQNAFWGKGSAIQRMTDFYFEQTRESVADEWSQGVTIAELEQRLNVVRVSYRVYYSKDNLTRRLFIFRPGCTPPETDTMLTMGFVVATDGDSNNIPDQPVEEVEVKVVEL
jgi:hypothetical protein